MTVYVVGLDGADWSLLEPWIKRGDLPAFQRLVNQGMTGDLESTLPPVTFPAWKCYSTGKTPGKLGVYEWFAYDSDTDEITANDANDFLSREYWDVLADAGVPAGVVNMPTTHPVDSSGTEDLFVVAGSPANERGEFTAPPNLKSTLLDSIPKYRIKPDLVLDEATPDELVSEASTLFEQRIRAATLLADKKDCELVHTTLFATDTLQHRLWDRPQKLLAAYKRIDSLLRELLDRDDTDAVFLMSDHGFQEISEVFLINQWLMERGDLVVESSEMKNTLASVGLTRDRLKRVIDRLGVVNLTQSLIPESVQRLFPSESGRLAIQEASIDWSATKAFSLGRGPIYLNDDTFRDQTAYEEYAETLIEDLEELETPGSDPVTMNVFDPADVYTGEQHRGPDILVEYGEGIDAPSAIGGDVFGESTEWLATHRRTGVFGACGTNIGEGNADLTLYDLAPTLLHYLGEPVPEDVDGEVRKDVLQGDPYERDVTVGPPTARGPGQGDTGKEVEDALRELGYLE